MTNMKSKILLIAVLVIICQTSLINAAEKTQASSTPAFTVTVTGSGRPMILIPGLTCGGNVWDGTVNHFKDSYKCHVVTLAGFAGQPATTGEPFLEQVRDGLIKYISDNKLDRPVIVGHSLGGFLAFWIGATAPKQVGPIIAVDGVPYFPALNDPKATPQSVQMFAQTMRDTYKVQTPVQFAAGNKAFLAAMITDPNDCKKITALSTHSDPKTVGQAFYEMMTIDLRGKVKDIQSPVLLIGATASIPNKKAAQENYRLQVANILQHKVVFAPKALHFIQLDQPKFFLKEVEAFLKETEASKQK